MNNSRVIHGIISVPNRVELKRNQIYNDSYVESLAELISRVSETSINLDCMIQKPLETEQTKEIPKFQIGSKEPSPEAQNLDEIVKTTDETKVIVEAS